MSMHPTKERAGVDSRWAVVIAVAAVLLIGMRQAFTVPYTGLGLSPAQLILLVVAVLWLVTRAVGQRAPAGLGLLSAVVVVRMLCTLLSYGVGSARVLTADQRSSTDRAIVTELAVGTLVFALATLLRSRRDIELVVRALVVGGALSALFALIRYGTGFEIAADVRLPGLREAAATPAVQLVRAGLARAQGSASVPLELAGVMTALIPLALGLFFAARRRGDRSWVWLAAVVLMTAGALVSLSRSVFIGLGIALVVMATRWPLRRAITGLAVVVIAGFVALASGAQFVSASVNVLVNGSNDFSLGSRAQGRTYVFTHLTDHLLLGQGPGTYDLTTQPVLDNQYLSQLIETGVVGLLLLVAVLACAIGYALRATTRTAPSDAVELAVGVAGALVAIAVISSVLDTAGFTQIFTLIWLLIGLAGAIWRVNVADVRDDGVSADRPVVGAAR